MNKLYLLLSGGVGALVGAGVTYFAIKQRFDTKLDEMVESVKNAYGKSINEETEDTDEEYTQNESIVIKDGIAEADENGEYKAKIKVYSSDSIAETSIDDGPVSVSREEFDALEGEGYDISCYVYYQDDVLTDEMDNIVSPDDIIKLVGADFNIHIGDYEDDIVLIRNDKLKMGFEVSEDPRYYYKDIIGRRRRGANDEE